MSEENLAGLMRPYRWEFCFLAKLTDASFILGLMALVCWVFARPWTPQLLPAVMGIVLFQFFAEAAKLYRSHRSELLRKELISIFGAWVAVTFSLLLLGYLTKTSDEYSRIAIGVWFLITPIGLGTWRLALRLLLRRFRRLGYNSRAVAIAGASSSGIEVANIIAASDWMGLRLTGVFVDP